MQPVSITWILVCILSASAHDELEDITSLLQLQPSHKVQEGHAASISVPSSRSGPTSPSDTYTLNDGYKMPVLGLGTYLMEPGNETYTTVLAALKMGYRMIDTASYYQNEGDVGRAIRDSGIPRSEIWVSTKVWNDDHGYDKCIQAGMKSNMTLGVGYIDLLLIHWPTGGKIVETYKALMHLRDIGVTRSIGVSNFEVSDLDMLQGLPTPSVNQIQLHPLNYQSSTPLIERCRAAQVQVQAYGSVLTGRSDLLSSANDIGAHYNKTSYQVMLRWALDKNFQIIPKSTHTDYLAENFDVFDFTLTAEDTNFLESLPQVATVYR
mmetsp:Transcript_28056/g.49745  ORF Transcript_28056/g.49745 Transcript_28056/m.49745 type:complete len:322 (-) Transcript_28056:110-1075(-)